MLRCCRFLTVPLMFMFLMVACNEQRVVYTSPAMSGGGQTTQGTSGISQEQFDLQTAIGLLRTNKVRDAQSLEAAINDSGSGINNVDLDGDGQIDYIGIQETVVGNERHMAFMACPSSKQGEPTKIADVTIRDDGQQVFVGGGYSSVFHGYNNSYYSYNVPRSSFGEALFLAWMLTPSRPYYMYRPYSYGWTSRPMYSPSVMHSTRTMYTTQTRVSPIQKVAPPAHYTQSAAVKMPSSLASKPAGSGLNGTAGQMRDYKVNTQPKQTGTAFGAQPSRPAAVAAPVSAPASKPWGGGGSVAKPASSGWGGGGSSVSKPASSGWGGGGSAARPSGGGFGGARSSGGSSGGARRK